jgi:hypothetical protein
VLGVVKAGGRVASGDKAQGTLPNGPGVAAPSPQRIDCKARLWRLSGGGGRQAAFSFQNPFGLALAVPRSA